MNDTEQDSSAEKYELECLQTKTSPESSEVHHEARKGCGRAKLFNQVVTAVSISLVSVVNGFISAYTSPVSESLRDSLQIDKEQFSWIGSLVPLGALVGGLMAGQCIDFLGRKTTVFMTDIMCAISWLCIASASNVWFLYVGRTIAGLAMGIMSLAIPVYLGETLEPSVRGSLGLFPTAFGNIGILVCYTAGSFMSWRNLAWFGLALPIPFLVLNFIIPETPRWYLNKNKEDLALKSLQWSRNTKDVTEEFRQLKENSSAQKGPATCDLTVFMKPANLKSLLAALGLMFFQQMSGITAVIFYTGDIFKSSGSTINEDICTIIVGIVNFVSVFISTLLIDRLGRKVLLYISGGLMTATLAILGGSFYITETKGSLGELGWIPLVSFVIFVLGFSLGYGPVPWLMLGEIFPVNVRGTAGSITTAFNWGCSFIVTKTFLEIISSINTSGAFWLYSCMCAISIIFVFAYVPETRKKSLEDIERKLAGNRRGRNIDT